MLGALPAVLVPVEPWEQAVVVLPAPMLGALPAVLVLAEPCPRMVELEAWADWQGRQVKAEPQHKPEAHKGPAEQPSPLAQVESRARGETPRRGATRATRLVDRVEPRRRALARVAVAAPSGASHGNGTNCCLLLLLRWDFRRDGGSAPAAIDSPRRRSRSWHCLSARARFRSGRPPDSKSRLVGIQGAGPRHDPLRIKLIRPLFS
jgi:hypothetical protein